MIHRRFFFLFALVISAITFAVVGVWRHHARHVVLLTAFSLTASAQNWTSFLDSSRATNWESAGFTIPNYTANCLVQPTLVADSSGAAGTNATAIQVALASCDSSHNVVNIPAGTYYVSGITYPSHGQQVLRGAGANATKLISTSLAGCGGFSAGICMIDSSPLYNGSSQILPGGSNQCSWTAGYAKGSTTLTLSNCGAAPPANHLILLDQANDSGDTGGIYVCDETTRSSCNYDGTGGSIGRTINGTTYSQIQAAYVTGVTSLGAGSYSVNISPGVYFTNVRSGQNPGAWWSGQTQLNGLENLTIDGSQDSYTTVSMYDCYQCWVKGVTLLNGARSSILLRQSGFDVIRDSYFYQAQGHASISYNIDLEMSSGFLIENNIMQQVTMPVTINNGTGGVIAYNYAVNNIAFPNYTWPAFSGHGPGNQMNLWEGNNIAGIESDDAWGSPSQQTYFRNMLAGWKSGGTNGSTPIIHRSYNRAFNIIGNVLGQPGYHTQYQIGATGNTTFAATSGQDEHVSIYSLGLSFDTQCGTGAVQTSPYCDAKSVSTLMRWGNYDVVTGDSRWDSNEASPSAVPYLNANFSSSHFGSLSHSLPASLYLSSAPSWWPSGKPFPAIGPDVSGGNLGICSGAFSGSQATASGQCSGGSLSAAWASHANSIPAQDCYLNVMHGAPDGTGNALPFSPSQCYGGTSTSSGGTNGGIPIGLTTVVY